MNADLIPGAVAAKLGAPTHVWVTTYVNRHEEGTGAVYATEDLAVAAIKRWIMTDLKDASIDFNTCKALLRQLKDVGYCNIDDRDYGYNYSGHEVHYE